MRIAFIDESRQKEPPRDGLKDLVSLGAAIFPEETIDEFQRGLKELRQELQIPLGEEIKWKPPRGSFLANSDGKLVGDFRRRMLELADACQVRSIVVIIDHGKRYASKNDVELGQELLKWLFERYTMLLDDSGSPGIMVADKPPGGPADERKWLAETLKITDGGTEYVKPGRVVMPVLTADSKHLPHLQLADLIVGATTAAVAGRKSGLALAEQLRGIAHRHSLGAINGAGLVLYPDEPNLYYWALGETVWAKASKLAGLVLPDPDSVYGTDDGLAKAYPQHLIDPSISSEQNPSGIPRTAM